MADNEQGFEVYQDERGHRWWLNGAWHGARCHACGADLTHRSMLADMGREDGKGRGGRVTILCLPCSPSLTTHTAGARSNEQ
jgi:hypothetical protein